MTIRPRLRAACVFALLSVSAFAQNRTFTGQYTFGDSLSDSGNLFALTNRTQPPPPYFNGRFSNGPVFIELLGSSTLATTTTPGRSNFRNFAVGGANVTGGALPNLSQQIGQYQLQGMPATPGDLFTVLMGANDLIATLGAPTTPANPGVLDTAGASVAQALAANVRTLVTLGAKNIVVGGLPNLGATPRSLAAGGPGGPGAAFGLRASNAFNTTLRNELATIAAAAPDVNLVYIDLQGFLDRVIADYRALGFNNATQSFLPVGGQPAGSGDPNSYVFWDDIHPTARTHALVAAYVLEHLNPEPVLGFAATQSAAALALQGLTAGALDARIAQIGGSHRTTGRADAYVSYNYGDGVRGREDWRPRFSYDAHVITAGADLQLRDGILIGGAINGGRLEAELAQERGSFTVENATGRVYGIWRGGPVSLILDGSYGGLNVRDIRRVTSVGGLTTRGKTSGHQWSAGARAAWNVDLGTTAVRPWLGLRTSRAHLDAYTERDMPGIAMEFAKQEAESTQGALGVDTTILCKLGTRAGRLDLRLAWRDEIGSEDRAVTGRLANNVTRPAGILVEDGDGSGVEVGGAATIELRKNWSASIGYTADIRTSEKMAHRATLSVQTGF